MLVVSRSTPKRRRWPWLVGGAVLAVAIAAGLVFFAWPNGSLSVGRASLPRVHEPGLAGDLERVSLRDQQGRAIPFARFRTRLVMALLGMTLIPAVLVLIVGSELIRKNIDQFFNAPMDKMLSSAQDIASDYYRERQRLVSSAATGAVTG